MIVVFRIPVLTKTQIRKKLIAIYSSGHKTGKRVLKSVVQVQRTEIAKISDIKMFSTSE